MAEEVAGELVGDRRDHSTVLANEYKRASDRKEDVGRSVPG